MTVRVLRRTLVAALAAAALWPVTAPLRSASSQQTPAVGVHKVAGATWRPEIGQLLFIAVLGSDARQGPPSAGGGCDAVHIVAVNPTHKAGTILNFPRDAYLGRKLTDICRASGFETAVRVLRDHTGFPIQYYAVTEFSHFRALIDELGGLEIEVPYAMSDVASGAYFNAGLQHLDGGATLAFTRNRKDTPRGDFSRTENQGLVMLAALKKFRAEASDPHRVLDYVRVARRHVAINMGMADIVRLGLLAREIDPGAFESVTIPGSTGTVGAQSVVFLAPGNTYDRVRDDAIYRG